MEACTQRGVAHYPYNVAEFDDRSWRLTTAMLAVGGAEQTGVGQVIRVVSAQDLDSFFADWLEASLIPDIPELGLLKEDYR